MYTYITNKHWDNFMCDCACVCVVVCACVPSKENRVKTPCNATDSVLDNQGLMLTYCQH